ncbi:MAG: FAD-dependent oxidoreductase, partial [Deltaproteobacteria bacterium]|nr:FAD-dependent oxidoreductase [Deltaproteobacteria bacterium]
MRIAIIGAGATGLSAAFDLTRAGHQVRIFEAGDRVGGLAAGFKAEHWDWTLEKFYHHWFQSDADMLGLINELGASDKVIFNRPSTVVYYDGKF